MPIHLFGRASVAVPVPERPTTLRDSSAATSAALPGGQARNSTGRMGPMGTRRFGVLSQAMWLSTPLNPSLNGRSAPSRLLEWQWLLMTFQFWRDTPVVVDLRSDETPPSFADGSTGV
jgi:hypothetical protein